jgi:cell wall-associated NlpC family hydrolase
VGTPTYAASAAHALQRPSAVSAVGARGELALHFALAQLGKPYLYGGTGPDAYDCSGLTQRAWLAAGVPIPRTTQAQAAIGTAVPLAAVEPGDIVIFYADASHAGIYAGDGKVVVAPHAGAVIALQELRWMPVYSVRRPG